MMADPWKFFTAEQLADATECPLENVRTYWPTLVEQMTHAGLADDLDVYMALAGTIAKESASQFTAVREAYWLSEAARWAEYTRRGYDGGPNYHGRGGIQHTHRYNYAALGPKIAALWNADPSHPDFDLVNNPDRLLDPDMSAAADVIYFRDKRALPTATWPKGYSLIDAAHAHDWEWVRRLVLGGADPDGVRRLERVAAMLGGSEEPTVPTTIPYNPDAPIDVQPNDWSCSLQSVQWLLRSIGRNPDRDHPQTDPWLTSQLVPAIVSPQVGLQDASGAQMAAWLNREYGAEGGWTAASAPLVTFDDVAAGAGVNPTMMGGRAYNHWVGVRRYDAARDVLELANPAPGFKGIGTTMTRQQFKDLGTFSAIYIDRAAAQPTTPEPPIVLPPAEDTRVTRARELIRQALAVLDEPAA